jgi:protein dithiol:quinone oxidoreductase
MRVRFAAGAVVCALLLGYGYYLQYVQGLDPCPLCQVQRAFYYAVGLSFAAGAVHDARGRIVMLYPLLAAVFAIGGIGTAGRQVWLQHLPADKVPQCGPDLAFMLKNLPLSRTLEKLFTGTGECAVVDWTFLGLSIAEWSLFWFVTLAAAALWLAMRGRRQRRTV